jgi:hypothetical protein
MKDYPGPAILSKDFLARAEVYPASTTNSDQATATNIIVMADYIRQGIGDRRVQDCARDAVWRFGGVVAGGFRAPGFGFVRFDPRNPFVNVWGDFWWAKYFIKFVNHESQLWNWDFPAGFRRAMQLLIAPPVVVRMHKPEGDCAIQTMMMCAFFGVQGIPYRMVTVKASPSRPHEWTHVYALAVMPSGRVIAVDASHGKYPGWSVPAEHRLGTQVWNENGEPEGVAKRRVL